MQIRKNITGLDIVNAVLRRTNETIPTEHMDLQTKNRVFACLVSNCWTFRRLFTFCFFVFISFFWNFYWSFRRNEMFLVWLLATTQLAAETTKEDSIFNNSKRGNAYSSNWLRFFAYFGKYILFCKPNWNIFIYNN